MPPKPSTAKLSAAVERATPTGAVATTEKKLTLRDVLESRREHVARALPKEAGLTPDRLLVIAETLVTANPALGQCAPRTLLGALMTTAQLGLEPGPLQHVYFVPRWNTRDNQHEVNFQLGYKGMVELARRAGVQIRTREVYANDDFEIIYGLEDQIVHRPTLTGERGDVIGYYLVATWTEHGDPRAYVLWMSKDDVDKIRLRSDAGKKDQGPWRTDYDAMARKGLALDTPIPTPWGWREMGDLRVGDVVFDMHGRQCSVTATSEIRNIDCYEVEFANGAKIVCDHDHRWLAGVGTNAKRDGWKVLDADALHAAKAAGERVTMPVVAELEIPEVALPIDPWWLGYWLGNGDAVHPKVTCNGGDLEDIVRLTEQAGYQIGTVARDPRGNAASVSVRGGMGKRLAGLGVLGDKHIPAEYLRSAPDQRRALLRGLIDSDGHIDKARGRVRFSSTNPSLAEGVAELARSLGEIVHVNERQVNGYGKTVTSYEVCWLPSFPPALLSRKLANYRARTVATYRGVKAIRPVPSVPTRCISVSSPTETYVAGVEMVPTHNTLVRRAFASNSIPTTQLIAQAVNVDDSVRREISAEAIDITPEEHRVEADHAASHAHAALGDGRRPDDDVREASAAQAEPRGTAPAGGTPGDGYRGDHADALTVLDAVPDDAEALVAFLTACSIDELSVLYGDHDIYPATEAEMTATDYIDELVERIIERRATR